MKLVNQSLPKRAVKRVVLPKQGGDLTVTIQALPLGFEDKVQDMLPTPMPRRVYARDQNGKAFKDKDGRYVEEDNDRDPKYMARVRKIVTLQGIAMLHEALKADKDISWETPEPGDKEPSWEVYYASIHEELKAANFTMGDLKILVDEVMEISGAKGPALKESRESFSPEAS